MNIGSLDLNLMLALDALLREANVTRAAERLNLTQPTVSASLARLRRHFDDDLLRRNGNQFELTPLALRLRPLVEESIESVTRLFSAHVRVDPARSTRRFAILASDYGVNVAGIPWSAQVARHAPAIRMAFSTLAREQLNPPEVRMRDVDGIIAPNGFMPESFPHIDVLEDRWVVVADKEYTGIGDAPSLAELRRHSWATTFEGPSRTPAGLARGEWAHMVSRVSVVVDTFGAIPLCVQGTQRLALMQANLVTALGLHDRLRMIHPPITMEPFRLAFWWHPAYSDDPEHRWLRTHLRMLTPPAAPAPTPAGTGE